MRELRYRAGLVIGILCLFLLTGCSPAYKADITLENSSLQQIKIDKLQELLKDKKTFIIMVTKSQCQSCDVMNRTLVAYFRERDIVPVYELKLDEQGNKLSDAADAYRQLQDVIPYFSGSVPQMFYYKEGEMKETISGSVNEIEWQNFMIQCGLIEGEKIEEPEQSYTLTTKGLDEVNVVETKELLTDNKASYLYYARNDRYNADYSKKLSKIGRERGIKISYLNADNIVLSVLEKDRQNMEDSMAYLNLYMDMNYSPALYIFRNGKVEAVLKDNVSEKELSSWLSSHPLNE